MSLSVFYLFHALFALFFLTVAASTFFLFVCCHFYLYYSFVRGDVCGRAVNTSNSGSEGPRLACRVVSLDKELYSTLSLFT